MWTAFKQQQAELSQAFETRLKPHYSSLLDGTSELPLHNVSVPFLVPVAEYLEDFVNYEEFVPVGGGLPWRQRFQEASLGLLLCHLDTMRVMAQNTGFYRQTAERIIGHFRPLRDLLEIFDTRMHMRLMWGAKAAAFITDCVPDENYAKFLQIIAALSLKCES